MANSGIHFGIMEQFRLSSVHASAEWCRLSWETPFSYLRDWRSTLIPWRIQSSLAPTMCFCLWFLDHTGSIQHLGIQNGFELFLNLQSLALFFLQFNDFKRLKSVYFYVVKMDGIQLNLKRWISGMRMACRAQPKFQIQNKFLATDEAFLSATIVPNVSN